jgi:hypothetical protein
LTNWTYSGRCPGENSNATRDARPDKQVGIILDTGGNALTQTTTMTYDNDLNVTENKSNDYGSVSASIGQTGAITSMPLGTLLKTEESLFVITNFEYETGNAPGRLKRAILPDGGEVKKTYNDVTGKVDPLHSGGDVCTHCARAQLGNFTRVFDLAGGSHFFA